MKLSKEKQRELFILFLCAVHLPFIFESFWYDEAALVENAFNQQISSFNEGLNWLQSIPPGYFLLSKLFLSLPFGIFIGRVFSLLVLAGSALIVDRNLIPAESRRHTRFLVLGLLMINSTSLKYGTDFKPYTSELLFSLAFIVVYKNPTVRRFVLLALVAPWFGATTFVSGFACIILTLLSTRKRIYIVPFLILMTNTFLVSSITPFNTQSEFRIAWFGTQGSTFLGSLKSAVGGLLWFPTSGLGWIFDNQFGSHTYLVSGIVMFLISFTILRFSRRDSNLLVMVFCFMLIATIHTLRILPVAGRLFQGLAALMLVVLFTSIEVIIAKQRSRLLITCLVIVISTISLSYKVQNFTLLKTQLPTKIQQRVYSDIDNAPETKYLASKESKTLESNLITGVYRNRVFTCSEVKFKQGDLVVSSLQDLENVRDISGKKVFKQIGTRNSGGFVFRVQNALVSSTAARIQDNLECKYKFRNAK